MLKEEDQAWTYAKPLVKSEPGMFGALLKDSDETLTYVEFKTEVPKK